MKMIYCTCNISVLDELIEMMRSEKIDSYQVVEKVTGKDHAGDPRLNTSVWPGFNSSFTAMVKDEKVPKVVKMINDYNEKAINRNEIITFCSWNLQEYICE